MRKIFSILCLCLFLISSLSIIGSSIKINNSKNFEPQSMSDYDPLVNLNLTFKLLGIRTLDKIDCKTGPDFYVILIINEEEFISPLWNNTCYIYNCWNVTTDVPDDFATVDIEIQLWDWNQKENKHCDISKEKNIQDEGRNINLVYDLRTGLWYGDDYNIGDSSGYGRVNGCGDGSIYTNEYDCELWFDIYQNDFDGDGLAYWIETEVYNTDPTVDNTGDDVDLDEIPIEWEHRWGFNPLVWDDHKNMDPDDDSVTNYEEFLVKDFDSDPYRRDVFLEIDYMKDEIDGKQKVVKNRAKEYLYTPFHRRNIVIHIDDEVEGGEIIPYTDKSTFEEVLEIWDDYFMHNDEDNWRRGVFHYVLFVHDIRPGGFAFSGDVDPYWGYYPGTDAFVVANRLVEKQASWHPLGKDYVYASLIMHETGHNFGIKFGYPLGCDNPTTKNFFKIGWHLWRHYKSIMNYRYTYTHLDYSDGSHGKRDFNDWEAIDLSYFEKTTNVVSSR